MADNTNPLFPSSALPSNQQNDPRGSYVLPRKDYVAGSVRAEQTSSQTAANLVRQKLAQIYQKEPDTFVELSESETVPQRSKHQDYMYQLNNSGKSLAEIQTDWHNYYLSLPDDEKHQVWKEFYASAEQTPYSQYVQEQAQPVQPIVSEQATPDVSIIQTAQPAGSQAVVSNQVPQNNYQPKPKLRDARSVADIKEQLLSKVTAGGKLKAKHHLQSLAFGLGSGAVVLFIFLFTFFNQVVITPFIQPNSHASATPVIVDPTSVVASSTPEVIIPKINVEIPTDYSQTTTDEAKIETALESGVVHYPTTVMPGQQGNTAYFGHSSNNIFNPGKYKFAFVLLHEMQNGDTFYLTNGGKVYAYKVISKTIVSPSNVSVLGPVEGQTATATLITCDPPGTSINRLVVVGQQVSPDPSGDTAASTTAAAADTSDTASPSNLPGNGPSLFSRLIHRIF